MVWRNGRTRRRAGDEARQVVDEVVQAADRPGFDEYRLRMETALHDSSFGPETFARLHAWARPESPFALRTFAFSALLARRSVDAATREALIAAAEGDADRAMRDFAARRLADLPAGEDSLAALRRTFGQTADWSLRITALTSLARLLPAAERDALLQQALADPDPRIARRARRLGPR